MVIGKQDHLIAVVAEISNLRAVSRDFLRQIITPVRMPSGHRKYSKAMVKTIIALKTVW